MLLGIARIFWQLDGVHLQQSLKRDQFTRSSYLTFGGQMPHQKDLNQVERSGDMCNQLLTSPTCSQNSFTWASVAVLGMPPIKTCFQKRCLTVTHKAHQPWQLQVFHFHITLKPSLFTVIIDLLKHDLDDYLCALWRQAHRVARITSCPEYRTTSIQTHAILRCPSRHLLWALCKAYVVGLTWEVMIHLLPWWMLQLVWHQKSALHNLICIAKRMEDWPLTCPM